MNDLADLAKSNQEQAVAAWLGYLDRLRAERLLSALHGQDQNLIDALDHVDAALQMIGDVVASNRGGVKGMHGFIAEVAEVGIGNARTAIRGEDTSYAWVNNNGPTDLLRAGVQIQQKFVAAGGRLGLGAIAEHLDRYPDFVANGGKYQIPNDHFETIQKLYAMTAEDAGKLLSRSGDGPSLTDWKRVQTFFSTDSIGLESVEASHLGYADVQRDAYGVTLEAEKETLRATDANLREKTRQENRPTVGQGARATLVAAGVEGGTTFVLSLVDKRRQGKKLKDLTTDDWTEIAGDTAIGAARGGVRGLSIYSLINLTMTSAAVANMMAAAAFGVADQANKFRRGEISEVTFIENAELVCLEVGVCALSSAVGQAIIPIPILGAVIGNTVGTIMYNAASSSLSARETALVNSYLDDQRVLDEKLAVEHDALIGKLEASMSGYVTALDRAFSPDIEVALLGSIELAREVGVPSEDILDTDEKVHEYFLD
ncbi:hypothetical protein [Rathayibacter festucae]|uniref:Uncharacterized protein n=1 Tax=Rathayibacter festucae DSM 15932 TaxID=1328866 RepID=A0A3Q9UUS2_9MICO|nr:hypothetical protein [Rathayibacter festucae]AZZ53551.1 hypothetical protein C1I64_16915 [Rathayibacter festucae DSM 15932]